MVIASSVLKERDLIKTIRRLAGSSLAGALTRGIGDDCAVLRLPRGSELLVTTDLCIENVHFRRAWHPAAAVGHRCITRGLSDIAAMGGHPLACFLSLGLPEALPQSWVNGFLRGLLAQAGCFKVPLAGGDISSSRQITADIILTGEVPAGTAVLRSGARPGDRLYVTGSLGGSAYALKQLFAEKKIKPTRSNTRFYPTPRIAIGAWLRERSLATAMIDVSDGLSVDLAHICEESHVTAIVEASKIPVSRGADLEMALHGGEDYELLFTVSRRARVPARIAGMVVTEIGEIRNRRDYSSAIRILGENGRVKPLPHRGWEHFTKRS